MRRARRPERERETDVLDVDWLTIDALELVAEVLAAVCDGLGDL